jgi:hypothetical protein
LELIFSIPSLKKVKEEVQSKPELQTKRSKREQQEEINQKEKDKQQSKLTKRKENDFFKNRYDFLIFTTSILKVSSFKSILSEIKFSTIIQFYEQFFEWIDNKELIKNKEWKLLYRASKHGFRAFKFHQQCNNKGPTLVIIQSNGFLFGGFTINSWTSSGGWIKDDSKQTFIFTLTNPHGIIPTKYLLSDTSSSIYCDSSYGPRFGKDICINDLSNKNSDSYSWFPRTYSDSTNKGRVTFTGQEKFKVEEIEVFGFN